MLLSVHWPAFYFWYGLIILPCLWASIGVRCSYSSWSFLSALATGKCTIIHVSLSLVITKSNCLKYGRVIWNHLLVNKQARTITSNKFIPIWLCHIPICIVCFAYIKQQKAGNETWLHGTNWIWLLLCQCELKTCLTILGVILIFIISVGATVAYTYLACLSKVQESRGVVP